MAAIRPASRLLPRQLTRLTSSTTTLYRPFQILTTITTRSKPQLQVRSHLHTSRPLNRDSFTSSAQTSDKGAANIQEPDRVPPTDFASNDAYPDGAPGEPKQGESLSSGIAPSKIYTYEDIASIASTPAESRPDRILIDVREPSELLQTGRIPGAVNLPISSAPDAFFMSGEDFEDKYGWQRPGSSDEVIFYCKAGVRSNSAARLAAQAGFGGRFGEFPGSWVEWEAKGGKVQSE